MPFPARPLRHHTRTPPLRVPPAASCSALPRSSSCPRWVAVGHPRSRRLCPSRRPVFVRGCPRGGGLRVGTGRSLLQMAARAAAPAAPPAPLVRRRRLSHISLRKALLPALMPRSGLQPSACLPAWLQQLSGQDENDASSSRALGAVPRMLCNGHHRP